MIFAGSVQQKGDSYSSLVDGEEPSLYTKWWYVVRIIHWHHAEGLIIPSLIIDWVLNQLQVLIFFSLPLYLLGARDLLSIISSDDCVILL